MGKFDGILLLSDWDGTFSFHNEIPKENVEAVKYFEENGGLFSIASGRNYTHLKDAFRDFSPNTYICCYNGGLIVSKDGEVVYENLCDDSILSALDRALSICGGVASVWLDMPENLGGHVNLPIEDYRKDRAIYLGRKFCKALIVTDSAKDAKAGEDKINREDLISALGYKAVRSWDTGIELIKKENNKGEAIRKIKELSGAKLSIGVGDYGNDADLLRAADIGYAVAGGSPELLEIADRVARPYGGFVIAGIVEDLDRNT